MFSLIQKDFIPISWLHQLAFCEYQFFLEKIRKIRMPPSREMLFGIQNHQQLYSEFKEQAMEIKEPIEKHIEKLLKKEIEPFLVREFFLKSKTFGLRGRIDELRLFTEKAIIADFKPKEKAFASDQQQLRGYALAFSDAFNWEQEIFTIIKSTLSGETVFLERFGEKEKQQTINTIERLKLQLDAKIDFAPTSNPNHCRVCRYRNVCGHSLVD